MMNRRHASRLETVSVLVPEAALEAYEAALESACETVGFFLADEEARIWRVEGVRDTATEDAGLMDALAVAGVVTGVQADLVREATEAEGWLARNQADFPPQKVGRRFLIRGSHETGAVRGGRIVLTLDAGLAFGSGEHGSTRGCLRALEGIAWRRPRRVLDLGTGSGVLAMGAAALLRRRVVATDIEPWSVRVAGENAAANGLSRMVRPRLANGWTARGLRGPWDLVFANILARPLCRMAWALSVRLAPGGTAVLAGLLDWQANWVLAAHRRHGLVLERRVTEGNWVTLVLRRR